MTIAVTCPCGGRFAAPPHLAGKTVRCPNCQQPLRVPAPSREPLAPLVNPFSDAAAPVTAQVVPPVAHTIPVAPAFHSQDPFGGKATVGGPSVGQPQAYAQTHPQPQSAPYTPGYAGPRKKSYALYYIAAAALLGFFGLVFLFAIGVYLAIQDVREDVASFEETPPLPVQEEDYAAARAQFKTALTRLGEAPQDWDSLETPPGAAVLDFLSGDLALRAYVDPPPADGRPKPGVVFLHGGFAWGDGDWEMPQPYREQGFVVMMPVLRGENGQSGHFSLYYNEVDDVLAATSAFAALPYVDENQLYIAGHSAGGTLATLTAMTSDRFMALASFSGSMSQSGVGDWDPDLLVYDESIERETLMRSPEAFAKSFKCPAQLFYGSQEADVFAAESKRTERTARSAGLNVQAQMIPGDHFSAVAPAIRRSIPFFRQTALTKGLNPRALHPAPPRFAPPPTTLPEFSPPDVPLPELPGAPDLSVPDPQIPASDPTDRPAPDGPARFIPNVPKGVVPPTVPRRPNISPPPRSRPLTALHLGVVTFEVSDYSGRLPQRMAAQHALIHNHWADFGRIEFDEEAGVIRVPVRRAPKMDAAAAKTALEAAGFKVGATTFKPLGGDDEAKASPE